jgi:hypothetical protein
MLLFLDTECTVSSDWRREPKAMSLALVTEDRHREFYAELADRWQIDDCSEFVSEKLYRCSTARGAVVQKLVMSCGRGLRTLRAKHRQPATRQSIFGFCSGSLASLCPSTCHGPIATFAR